MKDKWLFTFPDAAKLLGVGKQKIYDLIARRELPVTYLDGKRRISRFALEEYIERNTDRRIA